MKAGVIAFPRPEALNIVRDIRRQPVKPFVLGQTLSPCGTLFDEEGIG